MCPPLRSALLIDGVEHRHPAQVRVVARAPAPPARRPAVGLDDGQPARCTVRRDQVHQPRPARRASSRRRPRHRCRIRPSTHSCTMPGPNGPSRSTVGGTTPQPVAADDRYAATSRPASVPSGKSHSGRSPAHRLVDARGVDPVEADRRVAGSRWRRRRAVPRPPARRAASSSQRVGGRRAAGRTARRRATPRSARQRRYPLARGQMWPSGRAGQPQNGHGGRPAATTASARLAKARAGGAGRCDPQHAGRPRRPRRRLVVGPRRRRRRRPCRVALDDHALGRRRPRPGSSCRPGTPPRSACPAARCPPARPGRPPARRPSPPVAAAPRRAARRPARRAPPPAASPAPRW